MSDTSSVVLVLLTASTSSVVNPVKWTITKSVDFPTLDSALLALNDSGLLCASNKSAKDKERDKKNVAAFRLSPDHLSSFEILPWTFQRQLAPLAQAESRELTVTEIQDALARMSQNADYLLACLKQVTSSSIIRRSMHLASPSWHFGAFTAELNSISRKALTHLPRMQEVLAQALISATDVDNSTGQPSHYVSLQLVSSATFDLVKGDSTGQPSFFHRL